MTISAAPAIDAQGVCKAFGATQALAGVDLVAEQGEVLALLGPNGAGKTTLVRILTTLLRPDSGRARLAGRDVVEEAAQVRSLVGLTGQFAAVDLLLTGRENLEMAGELYHLSRGVVRTRSRELLERIELVDVADRLVRTYSGGMRRRLDLAASLIGRPPVLVLDEPTTGLDPRTRGEVWSIVEGLAADGTTILLTTQYLEEADRLARNIVLIDHGQVIVRGTAKQLKARLGNDLLEVHLGEQMELDAAVQALSLGGPNPSVDRQRRTIMLPAPEGVTTLRSVLDQLDRAGVRVDDIGIRHPSLDDVFLAHTGKVNEGNGKPTPLGELRRPSEGAVADGQNPFTPAGKLRRPPVGSMAHDILVITKRNVRRMRRTPRLLIVSSIQPVLYVLMFRFVFGGSLRIPGMSYIDYLLPGVLLTATLMGATTAVATAADVSGGMIDRFRSLPIARSAVLASRCLADLLRSILVVLIVFVVGLLLGFRLHTSTLDAVAGLAMVLATSFAFIWLYALIGLVVKDAETAHLAGFIVIMPLIFASSVFVRVQSMPGWLQVFARYQPVSVAVDTVRGLCEGGPVAHFAWQAGMWIAALVLVCGWLAVEAYKRA